MATTYTSPQVAAGYPVPVNHRGASFILYSQFTQTAAFVINDVVQMLNVPNGYRVMNVTLDTDQLDTNGSPTIKLDVGDATTANWAIAASTVAQTGGVAFNGKAGSTGKLYAPASSGGNPGFTTLQVKVNTAPATGTTNATLRLAVELQEDSAVAGAAFA